MRIRGNEWTGPHTRVAGTHAADQHDQRELDHSPAEGVQTWVLLLREAERRRAVLDRHVVDLSSEDGADGVDLLRGHIVLCRTLDVEGGGFVVTSHGDEAVGSLGYTGIYCICGGVDRCRLYWAVATVSGCRCR
jgi:hypothetical protein